MPRLFSALEIPSDIAGHLLRLQGGLPGARWIERPDLHITLRFIGDVDNPLANALDEAFQKLQFPKFNLQLSGFDVFGNSKPHLLFAGVQHSEALNNLQQKHERICQMAGLSPEKRNFKPHVTLARVRAAKPEAIANYLSNAGAFQSTVFEVKQFALYSARGSVGGGPYVQEAVYPLTER